MNLLKMLLGSRKPTLNKSFVMGNLYLKEQMKQNIIPGVSQMVEKEKALLHWLVNNNAPEDMIETSQRYLSHFRQRHKEYIEYAEGL